MKWTRKEAFVAARVSAISVCFWAHIKPFVDGWPLDYSNDWTLQFTGCSSMSEDEKYPDPVVKMLGDLIYKMKQKKKE